MQEIKQDSFVQKHDYIVLIREGTHRLGGYPKDTVFKILKKELGFCVMVQDKDGRTFESVGLTFSGGLPRFRFPYKNEVTEWYT